jgi:hypothetical protein
MTVAAPVSANADPSVGASQAAPTGKQSMVIDLVEMIGSATAGSLGSPPPQAVAPAHGGTEVLGWIATAPPLTAAMCKVLHSFGAISPSLAWFATNRMLFATLLWYLTALSVDAGLRLSPTLRRVLAANVLETTAEHIARAKDTDMVRVEAHMTCVAEAKGGGAPDVVWTGKTVFPVGAVMDATDSSGGVEGEGAVLLEFTTQLEFADERSQAEFDKVHPRTTAQPLQASRGSACRPWSLTHARLPSSPPPPSSLPRTAHDGVRGGAHVARHIVQPEARARRARRAGRGAAAVVREPLPAAAARVAHRLCRVLAARADVAVPRRGPRAGARAPHRRRQARVIDVAREGRVRGLGPVPDRGLRRVGSWGGAV